MKFYIFNIKTILYFNINFKVSNTIYILNNVSFWTKYCYSIVVVGSNPTFVIFNIWIF